MNFINVSVNDGIARVVLSRGKVNAFNEPMVEEMASVFKELAESPAAKAVLLTGAGKFFSFGFDIPELLPYSQEDFTRHLIKFTSLYTELFLYPKPVIAALNGHTIAGGCMIATACDYRIMISGKAKIGLNEINFGSSVFAGNVDILKFITGPRNAEAILLSGNLFSAEEALKLGLIDQISSEANLETDAGKVIQAYAEKDDEAFKSIKWLLRKSVAEEMVKKERDHIEKFIRIWYSEKTRKKLQEKTIQS
jgi:Delta3-Delta2-enoyl-CoA isomerase